ncbi:MAG: ATP-binding protein [bacterium]
MKRLFPVGIPVRGDDLVGREKEIEKICQLLKIGQSVAIIAPRRYGKTSLVLEVIQRIKQEKYLCGYVDIFRVISKQELAEKIVDTVIENKKISQFVKTIKEGLSQWMKRIEFKQIIEDFEFILKFGETKIDELMLLDEALQFPEDYASKNNVNLLMVYDEFGDLVKLNGEMLIKRMRAILQMQEKVVYVFSGSQESIMINLFSNSKSAFFRFARVIHLDLLPKAPLVKYIISKFSQENIIISDELAGEIIDRVWGHPYYTQLLCQNIYLLRNGQIITKEDIDIAIQETLNTERVYFEQIWEKLKTKKNFLEVIRFIASGNSNPYNLRHLERQQIYYITSQLEMLGYLKKIDKGQYELSDPLFKEYITSFVKEIVI